MEPRSAGHLHVGPSQHERSFRVLIVLDQAAFGLFLLALAFVIGWVGIPAGTRWRDTAAFLKAISEHPGQSAWRAYVLAVIRFRPEVLIVFFLSVALLLKVLYETTAH